MNAQLSFLDGSYTLIHIPLNLYPTFLQPILQILLPQSHSPPAPEAHGPTVGGEHEHVFLNISVTSIECSIVCRTSLARQVFEPAIARLPSASAKTVTVSRDSYAVFSVNSAGMDAGSRVVDLTLPLALAHIPVFFITTYFCDFILVPTKATDNVVNALVSGGTIASGDASLLRSPGTTATAVGGGGGGGGGGGRANPGTASHPSTPPPPSEAAKLQRHTFEQLRRRSVRPRADDGLRLVQCSGREPSSLALGMSAYLGRPSLSRAATGTAGRRPSWVDTVDTKLYTGLVSALVAQPRFLSVTLAQGDPPSLLLDRTLLPVFGDALVGDIDGNLVPVYLDLVNVSFEATGIVSAVAGKLVEEMQTPGGPAVELSYLSTARAGAVILPGERAAEALRVLEPLLTGE